MQYFLNKGKETLMKIQIDYTRDISVLFCKKALDNDTLLVCRVEMIPLPEENRCGYQFILERLRGESVDRAELYDVTSDLAEAENIFDLICSNDVYPCHLTDIIEDYLSA